MHSTFNPSSKFDLEFMKRDLKSAYTGLVNIFLSEGKKDAAGNLTYPLELESIYEVVDFVHQHIPICQEFSGKLPWKNDVSKSRPPCLLFKSNSNLITFLNAFTNMKLTILQVQENNTRLNFVIEINAKKVPADKLENYVLLLKRIQTNMKLSSAEFYRYANAISNVSFDKTLTSCCLEQLANSAGLLTCSEDNDNSCPIL